MRIGLREVAERAGVSESTVSRVVNDRPGVKDDTRVLVRRIIDDMGYEQAGLRLDTASDLVGLIVPELQNPIFPAFAQAIESDLAGAGYTCVVCTETSAAVRSRATSTRSSTGRRRHDRRVRPQRQRRGRPRHLHQAARTGAADGLRQRLRRRARCHVRLRRRALRRRHRRPPPRFARSPPDRRRDGAAAVRARAAPDRGYRDAMRSVFGDRRRRPHRRRLLQRPGRARRRHRPARPRTARRWSAPAT